MSKFRTGWFGNSHGHSLAARGIRSKYLSSKQKLVDPLFYAQKREEKVSFSHIQSMIRDGLSFEQMKRMHQDADVEDLRLRGIKAIESIDGDRMLSTINGQGIDASVKMAETNVFTRKRMIDVLNNVQKASFLPKVKVELLRKRLNEIKV